jgi:hypothetical protein
MPLANVKGITAPSRIAQWYMSSMGATSISILK